MKIHCTNRAVKNYGKALYKIRNDTSVAVSGRKLLTAKNIKALQDIAMKVLYINAHGLVEDLKADLLNGPNHVYNDHSKCRQTYCESVGDKENSKILELKNTGIYHHVHGKRLNLTQRGSFKTRANISGLQYNNGIGWQSETWKQITSTSPGEHFKKYVARLQHQEANRKERNKTTRTGVKRKLSFTDPCVSQPAQSSAPDYGSNAVEPTMSETEYNSEQQRILQNLQVSIILVTKEDIVEIEVDTKGQWDNPRYIMERKGRLTASRFGEVCKRRMNREPQVLVTQILYLKHFTTELSIMEK
ncbi:hypothetical protein ILUMI_21059 [Ignelater luminosus]|uniref:Mutator-like transposase domain-containing protein n=1 Tax=Ignelater luminosus TaxID=2038154 RepID=A0A8K0CCX4_IGNLU|nr:hypothetical protein ILUMI_21059 [Ignelater luminosus]